MASNHRRTIFIVSDGTGRTCEQVVRSALVQFKDEPVDLVLRAGIRTADRVQEVVGEAAEAGAIVFFTLVSESARRALKDAAAEQAVESVDILGPVFSGLNSVIHQRPLAQPGLYYKSERRYFDRMDAIDYTLRHDDGQSPKELSGADVVLVGVSRASKSSTCFFLGYRGIRAANVPLHPLIPPPKELTRLDPRRVIGLSINGRRLAAIRQARVHTMGMASIDQYAEEHAVTEEVRAAHSLMTRHAWRRIDVSYMAIEEVARQVIRLMAETRLRRRPRRYRSRG